jgi:hypothetical protein
MTDRPPAPTPPRALSEAAAHYADLLAQFVRDTGNADWIKTADAVRVLRMRDNVRTAQRQWEDQWQHYERDLVAVLRRAGYPDAEIAKALGIPRQNLHRLHGKRSES